MYAIPFPPLDPVAFEIGPLQIRWYALAYLAGFLGGWRYALYLAQKVDLRPSPQDIDEFLTWMVIAVILGGRLGYVLFYNLPYYIENPVEVLQVWEGGMSFHGGMIAVILTLILFAHLRGFSAYALGDVISAVVPIGLFFGRLANFVNAELYGRVTDAPWGVVFPQAGPMPRHPSQLYEAFLEGIVLFAVLFVLARREDIRRYPGTVGGVFMIGYGLARFLVEFVREPDPQLGYLWLGLSMGQWLSLPMILVGLWFILRARVHGPQYPSPV